MKVYADLLLLIQYKYLLTIADQRLLISDFVFIVYVPKLRKSANTSGIFYKGKIYKPI